MVDLASILANHRSKKKELRSSQDDSGNKAQKLSKNPIISEIPDIFFDDIVINYRLNRLDILVLIFLYRKIWCRPNLHKMYGIGPIISHVDLKNHLKIELEEIYQSLKKLENLKLIETIRLGQYFIRKYFTEENDKKFGQSYDNY